MIDNTKSKEKLQKTRWLMSSQDEMSEYESAVAFLKEFHARNVALHPSTALFRIDEEETDTGMELETSSALSCSSTSTINPLHEENQCQIKHCASFPPQEFDAIMNNDEQHMWSLSALDTEEIIDDPKGNDHGIKRDGVNHYHGVETSESPSWGFFTQ
eukprot:CAMPEP_0185733352 /NCGR_PEP_ID=MMETSP1171-20130828/19227_1 /TAXON_ID=374046 /ORGANISM="Helicotheca tamensis, Strain CCMP826" /LENGTH=157 /DNA_ID=CAMNT_0028403065 /DNA_START=25 /DNA_END=498 /DNA_ORIENTATION=+